MHLLRLHVHDRQRAFSEIQRRHHGCLYPLLILLRRLEAVNHQLDEMGLVAVQSRDFVQFAELSVNTHLSVSALAHLLEELLVMALPALHQRRKEVAFAVLIVLHNQGDDLLVGVSDHGLAGLRRICSRGAGIEKSEEIVDFRDRSNSRARVVSGSLLFDRDDRAETRNRLNLRLFQYAHKVLGIGRERIHVPSLALRIYGIEGQRRLSASAQSRHDDKLPARNRQTHPFQIMGPRPLNLYVIVFLFHTRHRSLWSQLTNIIIFQINYMVCSNIIILNHLQFLLATPHPASISCIFISINQLLPTFVHM